MAAQYDAFNELVRVVLHHDTILERTRLRFVGVDDHVAGMQALRQKTPLDSGGETRAAAAADAAGLDLFHHVGRLDLVQHTAGGGIAAVGLVWLDPVAVRFVQACHQIAGFHAAGSIRGVRCPFVVGVGLRSPARQVAEAFTGLEHIDRPLHILSRVKIFEIADLTGLLVGDDSHRRGAARAETLHMIERKLTIFGLFTMVDVQCALEVVKTLVPAPQHARHVCTHFNMILALWLFMQHVVEADDRAHLRRGDSQDFGQLVLRLHRAVAKLPLDYIQCRQNPRTLPSGRIACQYLVDLLPHRFRDHCIPQLPVIS